MVLGRWPMQQVIVRGVCVVDETGTVEVTTLVVVGAILGEKALDTGDDSGGRDVDRR